MTLFINPVMNCNILLISLRVGRVLVVVVLVLDLLGLSLGKDLPHSVVDFLFLRKDKNC